MQRILLYAGYTDLEIASATLAIVGRSWSTDEFFVTQMISNVVDADKLDYMFRDGFMTRVPLAVDLERLLYKLEVVHVPAEKLSATKLGHIPREAEVLVLGTSVAGDRLAYEVAQARAMLFERVYFHHKTRAAERTALEALALLDLYPAELLAYDDSLFESYGSYLYPESMADVSRWFADRRLPKRCFAISPAFAVVEPLEDLPFEDQDDTLPGEPSQPPPEEVDPRDREGGQQVAKRAIDWMLNDPQGRAELAARIVAQTEQIAELLGEAHAGKIWVDTTPRPSSTGGAALVVVRPDGTPGVDQGYAPAAAAETYEPLHIAFVFTDGAVSSAPVTYVACELALAKLLQIGFDRNAADYAKIDFDAVEDRKRSLESADPNIFSTCGFLRPRSRYVESAGAAEAIDALAERFHTFSTDRDDVHVDAARIRRFLHQFPGGLVEPMLELLGKITFLDRQAFKDFASYVDENAPDGAVLAPLTSVAGKSADHLPYFFADRHLRCDIAPLSAALERGAPIVVYDDLLLSGTQSEKILRTWVGEQDHRSAQQLTAEQLKALQENLSSFQFGWAWQPGVERLAGVARELELPTVIGSLHREDRGDSPLAGSAAEDDLRTFLAEVGTSLLLSTRGQQSSDPWDEQRCEENSLGYGNSERLVVTEYNSPAGTFTALWKHGAFRQTRWLPLFPRRRS